MFNYYIVSIKGKNIKKFIKDLIKDINIYSIKYLNDEALLKVSYEDYVKINKIKTSYIIRIKKVSGSKKVYSLFNKYKLSIYVFIINIFLCVFLSNLILFINIDTDNKALKDYVYSNLNKNNITVFSLKKGYKKLNKVILDIKKSPNIEWLEFDQKGVYLNVKVIERVKKEIETEESPSDIVALKNGYIRKIQSSSGEIIKNIDDYVLENEVIISGNIFKNGKVVGKTKAEGKVYAEVWYIAKANRSLYYNDLTKLKKGRVKLILNILNHDITFISVPKSVVNEKNKILFHNKLFTLSIKKEKRYKIENKKYTKEELSEILKIKTKNDISKKLDKEGYIIEQKVLKKYIKNDKMYIEVFFKTYENIAVEKALQEIKEEDE